MSSVAPVQNPQLRNALHDWQQAAQPFLSTYLSGKSGRFAKWLIARDLQSQDSHLNGLPETAALLTLATRMPEFWAIDPASPPSGSGVPYTPDELTRDVLANFAFQFFHSNPGSAVTASVFDDLYADLEQYLFNYASMQYSTTIELWHVRADDQFIDLPPHAAIRHLTASEQSAGSTSAAAGPPPN
jgi:hypothetical protein